MQGNCRPPLVVRTRGGVCFFGNFHLSCWRGRGPPTEFGCRLHETYRWRGAETPAAPVVRDFILADERSSGLEGGLLRKTQTEEEKKKLDIRGKGLAGEGERSE